MLRNAVQSQRQHNIFFSSCDLIPPENEQNKQTYPIMVSSNCKIQ